MTLQVGYAQEIITPALDRPVYLAGFGQNRRAESVHDDLSVRALALQTENTTLILCALDLIGFFRPHVLDVILRFKEQYPQVQVILASTHTHHGPDTMGLWGPDDHTSGVDQVYLNDLMDKIVATLLAALSSLQPAAMKTACVQVPDLAKNARNPEIRDEELTVAQFLDRQRHPLVTLANFPCHPEVLWEHNPHITADYPGYLRREIESNTQAPSIFFSGALGGMMTPDVQEHSFEAASQMGARLAAEGLQAMEKAAVEPEPVLSVRNAEIQVKLTNILFKLAFNRKLLPDVRDRRGHITTEVNLIKLGSLWLATVPGELLPKLGLRIKSSLREAGTGVVGVIGLANDELGYILPKEDFRYPLNPFRPGKHYEETMSISKNIGPTIVEAVLKLL